MFCKSTAAHLYKSLHQESQNGGRIFASKFEDKNACMCAFTFKNEANIANSDDDLFTNYVFAS